MVGLFWIRFGLGWIGLGLVGLFWIRFGLGWVGLGVVWFGFGLVRGIKNELQHLQCSCRKCT